MRIPTRPLTIVLAVAAVGVALGARQGSPGEAPARPPVSKATFEGWMKNDTNWGRWGKDDQLGAVNLITLQKRKQAIALAKTGTMVSLAHRPPLVPKIPDQGAFLEIQPLRGYGFNRDHFDMVVHGLPFTHIDALCHASYNDTYYNGYTAKDVLSANGCAKLALDNLSGGIITRGIVIDIPALKHVDTLAPSTHIYPEDIEAFEKMAGLKIGSGDAVLLHTGRWLRSGGGTQGLAGYDPSVLPWLKKRDVAIVGSDGGQDVEQANGLGAAVHQYVLVAMGANIVDAADLTAAVETARRLKRWEFMLTLSPAAVSQTTGFLINPIALF